MSVAAAVAPPAQAASKRMVLFNDVTLEDSQWTLIDYADQFPIECHFDWRMDLEDDAVLVDLVDEACAKVADQARALEVEVATALFQLPQHRSAQPALESTTKQREPAQGRTRTRVAAARTPRGRATIAGRGGRGHGGASASLHAGGVGASASAGGAELEVALLAARVVARGEAKLGVKDGGAVVSDGGSGRPPVPASRERKDKHTNVEKRRRNRERDAFVALHQSLRPLAEQKLQRQEILDGAVDYIVLLEAELHAAGRSLPAVIPLREHIDESGESDQPPRKRQRAS